MGCVDEVDVMIANENFQQTCINIIRGLDHSNCQMMFFSTTYSNEAMQRAREIVQNPVVLRLKQGKQTLVNIRQYFIRCSDSQEKYNAIGQTIIFCRTEATTQALATQMKNQQHSVRELTSSLDIEQFRKGVFRMLTSTNVELRGQFSFILFSCFKIICFSFQVLISMMYH